MRRREAAKPLGIFVSRRSWELRILSASSPLRAFAWESPRGEETDVPATSPIPGSVERKTMVDTPTENKAEGTWDKIKGRTNQAVGSITGNDKQQIKGKAQEIKGEAKEKLGDFKNAMKSDEDL